MLLMFHTWTAPSIQPIMYSMFAAEKKGLIGADADCAVSQDKYTRATTSATSRIVPTGERSIANQLLGNVCNHTASLENQTKISQLVPHQLCPKTK
jgi:hypothetical protein